MTANPGQRIAHLAGESVEALSAAERAELDELRARLSEPETWAEPDPELEARIVAVIAQEAAARTASSRRHR